MLRKLCAVDDKKYSDVSRIWLCGSSYKNLSSMFCQSCLKIDFLSRHGNPPGGSKRFGYGPKRKFCRADTFRFDRTSVSRDRTSYPNRVNFTRNNPSGNILSGNKECDEETTGVLSLWSRDTLTHILPAEKDEKDFTLIWSILDYYGTLWHTSSQLSRVEEEEESSSPKAMVFCISQSRLTVRFNYKGTVTLRHTSSQLGRVEEELHHLQVFQIDLIYFRLLWALWHTPSQLDRVGVGEGEEHHHHPLDPWGTD